MEQCFSEFCEFKLIIVTLLVHHHFQRIHSGVAHTGNGRDAAQAAVGVNHHGAYGDMMGDGAFFLHPHQHTQRIQADAEGNKKEHIPLMEIITEPDD